MVTARVPIASDGAPDLTSSATEPFPLLIAVAASLEERVRLAELVDDVAPLLLVSGLDELRRLIAPAQPPPTPSDPEPAAEADAEPDAGTEPDQLARVADILTIDSARSVAQWHG